MAGFEDTFRKLFNESYVYRKYGARVVEVDDIGMKARIRFWPGTEIMIWRSPDGIRTYTTTWGRRTVVLWSCLFITALLGVLASATLVEAARVRSFAIWFFSVASIIVFMLGKGVLLARERIVGIATVCWPQGKV
jgi:hypothetical protein